MLGLGLFGPGQKKAQIFFGWENYSLNPINFLVKRVGPTVVSHLTSLSIIKVSHVMGASTKILDLTCRGVFWWGWKKCCNPIKLSIVGDGREKDWSSSQKPSAVVGGGDQWKWQWKMKLMWER